MTVAIGLVARDGLVVAADTQESTGDYLKGSRGKIMTVSHTDGKPPIPNPCCVISGAGESGYVRAVMHQIAETFSANREILPTKFDRKDPCLEDKFTDTMRKFYQEHVIPFASFRKAPDVEMLIATNSSRGSMLFTTEKSTVSPAFPYAAIGYGSVFCNLLIERLWGALSVDQAEVLAAYIIFMAKESVESCGKYTSIVTVRLPYVADSDGKSTLCPSSGPQVTAHSKIEKWEHSFRNKWWAAERSTIWKMMDKEISK